MTMTTLATTTNESLSPGCRVQVWTGEVGQLAYQTADGWCGVALDGERTVTGGPRIDEWQAHQVRAVVRLPAA